MTSDDLKSDIMKILLVLVSVAVLVYSKPSKGEFDEYSSEPKPTQQAAPTPPWIPSCPKFETFDMCRRNYCFMTSPEKQFQSNLDALKEASKLIVIPENFLIELATQAPDNCLLKMNALKDCLRSEGKTESEKLTINTFNASDAETLNNTSVAGNCVADQISLEKCVIEKNRYHPCPPAHRDLSELQKLDNEWKKGLAKILRTEGFEVAEETTSGGDLNLQINNCSEQYESTALKYSYDLPYKKLPDLFDSVRLYLDSILWTYYYEGVPLKSRKEFADAVRDALLKTEILDIDEAMKSIIETEKNFKEPLDFLESDYVEFNKVFQNLLAIFPKTVQDKCESEKLHQLFIRSKIDLIEESRIIDDWDRKLLYT